MAIVSTVRSTARNGATPLTQPALPQLWTLVARCAGLTEGAAWQWWRAIRRSNYSRPVEFRRRLLAQDAIIPGNPDQLAAWVRAYASPLVLVALLEDLIHEQVLVLRDANAMMEPMLRRTNRAGGWKTGKE